MKIATGDTVLKMKVDFWQAVWSWLGDGEMSRERERERETSPFGEQSAAL